MKPELQKPKIIEALQKAVQKKGIRDVAAELELSQNTLYSSLNPYGDRNVCKMGLENAIAIMAYTGDKTALSLIAGELGCSIIEMQKPDKPTVAEECLQDFTTLGELVQAMQNNESKEKVFAMAMQVNSELVQTLSKYMESQHEKRS